MQKVIDIINIIQEETREGKRITHYRDAIIGVTDAQNERFKEIKKIYPEHLLPQDLLATAKTVIAFFLPFSPETIRDNRGGKEVALSWVIAYGETNALISHICEKIQQYLAIYGHTTTYARPTHNFDEKTLTAPWSHRHVAWAAGLGSFGHNHLLITPVGSAGRFGSLVTDAEIPEILPHPDQQVFHAQCARCGWCIKNCPSGAITKDGLDRHKCYQFLLENDRKFRDHYGVSDVCGKCVVGPCAIVTS